MKQKLILNSSPFSINRMTYRDKRQKTEDFKQWVYGIEEELRLERNQKSLKLLRDYFDPKLHYYSVSLTFYYPAHLIFTKDGYMSAKAHDCSNIEKPLIDIIFLPQYKVENLEIDDKYIADLHSRKRPLEGHCIEVELEIKNVNSLLPFIDD